MEAFASSAACALMIVVFAVALLGLSRRRDDPSETPEMEVGRLRREVADLRTERGDREPQR